LLGVPAIVGAARLAIRAIAFDSATARPSGRCVGMGSVSSNCSDQMTSPVRVSVSAS
jgi:hypothetical protein